MASTDASRNPTTDGSGEELIDDRMDRDYRAIPLLDRYESDDLDNADQSQLGPAARARVDQLLDQAQSRSAGRRGMRRGRQVAGLALSDEDDRPTRRARKEHTWAEDDMRDEPAINLDDFQGPVLEVLKQPTARREVRRRFRRFLTGHKVGDVHVYTSKIEAMCGSNGQSLEVNFMDFRTGAPVLAIWLADEPGAILEILNEECMSVVLHLFPEYNRIHAEIFVRITDLPIQDSLRQLRTCHLRGIVSVPGVVTRRTQVFPQLRSVKYVCGSCATVIGPILQRTGVDSSPSVCPGCDKRGPFSLVMEETVYRNYQRITLQESPGNVPPGRIPRSKDVILTQDLVDCCRPGDEVTVIGIFSHSYDTRLNAQSGFPVFSTVVEANNVLLQAQSPSHLVTVEDREQIRKWAAKRNIGQILFQSMAPSIYGHDDVKRAIALSLFGGVSKRREGSHRIRGDVNVLLMGDPGTAKSQVLKFVQQTASRCVYTTGKGASAVGLTAAVHKDPVTREWTLEGGALVLADSGHCVIDEFDKMNDRDRTSIHEAMEQQSISVSKAGIVTTLQARCAVLAAANPIEGKYDMSSTFKENVDITDAIMSRFDVLVVLRDIVDPVVDFNLASHVVNSHAKSHPEFNETNADHVSALADPGGIGVQHGEVMPQTLLKKYISFARSLSPRVDQLDEAKLTKFYVRLRQAALSAGGIPVAPRHLESIIRMAEAHAKMHLREHVEDSDLDLAIEVMLSSFIGSQKLQVQQRLQKQFSRYLSRRRFEELLFHLLRQLSREKIRFERAQGVENPDVVVSVDDLQDQASRLGIPGSAVHGFCKSDILTANGYVHAAQAQQIRLVQA